MNVAIILYTILKHSLMKMFVLLVRHVLHIV